MAIRKVNSRSIGVDVIAAEDLAANSVTVSEISNGAVTPTKLSTGAPAWATDGAFYIGTSDGSGKLQVVTGSPSLNYLHLKETVGNRYVDIGQWITGYNTIEAGNGPLRVKTQHNNEIVFATNQTDRVTISSGAADGLVQIGQQSGSSSSTLGFVGNDNAVVASKYSLVHQIDSTNSYTGRTFEWKTGGKGYGDGNYLMTLNQSARLGVNFSSPTHTITSGGSIRYGANSRSVIGWAEGYTTTATGTNYMQWKTNLWGGGSGGPGSNSQPTMSLFTFKGYDYRGYVIDSSLGFHNWSGGIYSASSQDRGTLAVSPTAYVSSDGYVVLRITCSNCSYFAVTIDWHQIYGYTYQPATVTGQTVAGYNYY